MSSEARNFIDDMLSVSYETHNYPKVVPTLVKDMTGRKVLREAVRVWKQRYGDAEHYRDFQSYRLFLRDMEEHVLNASRAQVAQYVREERAYFRSQ